MRFLFLSTALLAVSACATAPSAMRFSSADLTAPVIAAERAFAERHKQVPLKQAFQEYAAADGVALRPTGVRNVQEDLASWPDANNTGAIGWWPMLAGVAQSGDLGFTTGPATYPGGNFGGYFTIWKKQPDGSWKWVIDQGTGQNKIPVTSQPGDAPTIVPVSNVSPMDSAQAWKDLLAVDAALGAAMAEDAGAMAAKLAPEAWLTGLGKQPSVGLAAAKAEISTRPAKIAMKPEGGGVSAAGDFGWTYGYASWIDNGGEQKRGPYLRAWQRRDSGWVIVADNLNQFGRN